MRFTDIKVALDEVAERTSQNNLRITNAIDLLQKAAADLAALPGDYSGIVQAINNGAAANPSNDAWQTAKDEKDQLVSDFQDLRTDADALVAAVAAVTRIY